MSLIKLFTADKLSNRYAGEKVTLSWQVQADSVTINHGIGTLSSTNNTASHDDWGELNTEAGYDLLQEDGGSLVLDQSNLANGTYIFYPVNDMHLVMQVGDDYSKLYIKVGIDPTKFYENNYTRKHIWL